MSSEEIVKFSPKYMGRRMASPQIADEPTISEVGSLLFGRF